MRLELGIHHLFDGTQAAAKDFVGAAGTEVFELGNDIRIEALEGADLA